MSPYLKPVRRPRPSRVQPSNTSTPIQPRGKRLRRWPRFREWRRWGPPVASVILVGIVIVVGYVAWISQDLPDPNNLNSRVVAQSTKIYARDGKTVLYDIHGDQRRTVINLKDIGQYSKAAVLAIEDKNFYKEKGFSIRGIIRSIYADLTHGSFQQGGSTITQQLVKNTILTGEKKISRKLKELILSYQMERRFSKDQILKLYFNQIPWGGSAYGIEAAAQTYFGIHAKDLDLAQSALLAAMVQAPTHYSPNGSHQAELLARQRFVISLMAEQGYVTKDQAEAAKKVDVIATLSPYRDQIIAPHFVFYVRDLLVQKYGDALVDGGGLRVVTTLDPSLQKIAEEEITAGVARNVKYRASNAALTAIDPHTGQILAMVGSKDFFDQQNQGNFNVATAVRNPGSSFKPFVYLTAFTEGYTPDTVLFDLKTNFGPDGSGKDFIPNNYDLKEHGPLKMRYTLAGSLNIPAVKTLYLAGITNTLDLAERFGYTTFDRSKLGLALAIGGGGVKLIEHVDAFAALANDGVYNPTAAILRVEDAHGKVLDQWQTHENRAVDQQYVRELVDIMSDNNARAFVFGSKNPLTLPDRPVAAKTGTTNNFVDGWTMGFTPSLAAGVWVGNNDNSPTRADGVVVAGPIWHNFMARATKGTPVERFQKPGALTTKKPVLLGKTDNGTVIHVDAQTGKKIPDSCLAQWPKKYVTDQTVNEVHDILFYVDRSNPTGPVPTDPTKDPMFTRWDQPVQVWAKKNHMVAKEPALESCSLRVGNASGVTFSFTSPAADATITDTSLPAGVTLTPDVVGTTVQYTLDGSNLGSPVPTPYSTTLDLTGISNGFHQLQAAASDATSVIATTSITINILTDQTHPTLYFISPTPHTKVSQSDFPKSVQVYASAPSGISSVTLNLRHTDGTMEVVDTIESPTSPNITFSWSTTVPGTYDLILILTPKDKKIAPAQSDALPVTVL